MKNVVTGISMVTCLGSDVNSVWDKICQAESGIGEISLFDTSNLRSSNAGQVQEYDTNYVGSARMKAFAQMAIINAIKDSGLSTEEINNRKSILIIGTSLGHIFENENGPVQIDDYIDDIQAELNLHIPYLSVSSACSSGTDAISIAADLIEYKDYEIVICGGVDILDIYKMQGHSSLRTLALDKCRPFTGTENKGTSLGEGAAFMVLESEDYCIKDNSERYAKLIASANTTDTESVTAPDETGEGAKRMIENALNRAKINADDIDYINAHGSGTPLNDRMEANIYNSYFKNDVVISSTKGAFGHSLGATGAIEAAISVMAIKNRQLPPTSGTEVMSKEWNNTKVLLNHCISPKKAENYSLSVTYGFGGANSCIIFSGV